MEVSHLQYADDMIIMDNSTIDNLWTIKTIQCGFEPALGLCMNFPQSSLIGVNSNLAFLDLACDFLHCNQDSIPFKYLGILVDVTPS